MKITEVFKQLHIDDEFASCFDRAEVKNVTVNKSERTALCELISDTLIPKAAVYDIEKQIEEMFSLRECRVVAAYPGQLFGDEYFEEIYKYLEKKYVQLYCLLTDSEIKRSENDEVIEITLKGNGADILNYNGVSRDIERLIYSEFKIKCRVKFINGKALSVEEKNLQYYEIEKEVQKEVDREVAAMQSAKPQAAPKKEYVPFYKIPYAKTKISELDSFSGKVEITGEIFEMERKDFKNSTKGKITFFVTDYESSCICAIIDKLEVLDEFENTWGKGSYCTIQGEMIYDSFIEYAVLSTKLKNITEAKKKNKVDTAEEKRVELHLHTNMSAIDGVNTVEQYLSYLSKLGHRAIVLTDHGVVQAFPDAYNTIKDKKYDIKLVYGVEGYLINDLVQIVKGNADTPLDGEFVVFDLETTGLSAVNNKIIEIGACKVRNGEIVDRFSTFVDPEEHITKEITELTNITDAMVQGAPKWEEAVRHFVDFCQDAPLVAHNASFDVAFIRNAVDRLKMDYHPVSIDTVGLARELLPELKKHKLNLVCDYLGIELNGHHRAVNDAEATAKMFIKFLEKLSSRGIDNINRINSAFEDKSGEPAYKGKAYHIIILAKNKTGLKNLYKLVSKSHIDYFFRQPRIPKSELIKHREGLIIGSACEAGELYIATRSGQPFDELCDIASFYDYLEIQPLGNNQYLINNGSVENIDGLIEINKTIIEVGKALNKKVVATGDVHFIDKEGAVYRKILMSGKKFDDADNQPPLYYRTTEEMLKEFYYLPEKERYEIVVKNPNDIVDMVDDTFEPVPKEKHPPVIAGAAEDIERMSYEKAYEIYGNPLPELVQKRMEKELNSIINNGFSVMYRIAEKLVKKSVSDGYLVGSRGSVGSSFIAFLSGITEVNSLCPHYICENCKHSEFIDDGSYSSGCDMEDKVCPECGRVMKKDGHDIPFETFLGFDGDKEPDIDLNFSGEYQGRAHKFIEEEFGEGHVFRAGTIGTIADKTAFGYVKKYYEERDIKVNKAEMQRLVVGCTGAKATTGQHPGGIMIVPIEDDVYDFTPIQHPANDKSSGIITTHFDYHKLHDTLLKLDILGHDDPTMLKMLKDLTGLDPREIPLGDKPTMSLFTTPKALGVTSEQIGSKTGTFGVPEFGTSFARQMLEDIQPTSFASLVRIAGLAHGTDVWLNNAQDIVRNKVAPFEETICTRDDIMTYLIHKGLDPKTSFNIMESVRKGKVAKGKEKAWDSYKEQMIANNVPQWYIESCEKIQYMFPKAHAVAYVTMSFRVAYYKVHYPIEYYTAYYSVRADDFDADIMTRGADIIKEQLKSYYSIQNPSAKEKNITTILEICNEMYERGIEFLPVDVYKSDDKNFIIENGKIRPPLTSIKGLGLSVAQNIKEARKDGEFFTKEDFMFRAKVGQSTVDMLDNFNCFEGVSDTAQISFDI
ncbi:MAG: PolC-type DNA polymerase III [Ruminococcaceae bacterium]|nr:PolC-type DNA polymerase III [Oscillospiraceae bacterium]